jgi:hypothetical protein
VRDAASQLHLLECRKYNAEFERRLALEKQVTELTAERDSLKQQVAELTEKLGELPDEEDEPFPEPYPWQVGDEIECPGVTRRKVVGTCRPWVSLEGIQEACPQPEWERRGWKLYRKASDVPPEPAPEPYQWQVGDEIEDDGGVRRPVTERNAKGWVFIKGNGALPQFEWERRGWKLHRKASELPDIPPLTEQQVAEFAAATKPFDDSVSAAAADEGRP